MRSQRGSMALDVIATMPTSGLSNAVKQVGPYKIAMAAKAELHVQEDQVRGVRGIYQCLEGGEFKSRHVEAFGGQLGYCKSGQQQADY